MLDAIKSFFGSSMAPDPQHGLDNGKGLGIDVAALIEIDRHAIAGRGQELKGPLIVCEYLRGGSERLDRGPGEGLPRSCIDHLAQDGSEAGGNGWGADLQDQLRGEHSFP